MMSLLKTALTENQLALNDETRTQLLHYLDALNKWNKVINLTSITDAREMVYLHVIDSLLLAPFLQGKRLLDVGTGGGLPGIPLALLLPETEWVLLDKSAKKTRFLLQMKAELALHNVEIMTSRTEDFQPLVPFDCIVSRAYGTLRLLTEASKHLLSDQGRWCFMKGRYPIEELNDLPSFVKLLDVIPIKMQGMTVTRHVVRCRR
jgi:16S rRNA (guanine527-N7)-methyltransferase